MALLPPPIVNLVVNLMPSCVCVHAKLTYFFAFETLQLSAGGWEGRFSPPPFEESSDIPTDAPCRDEESLESNTFVLDGARPYDADDNQSEDMSDAEAEELARTFPEGDDVMEEEEELVCAHACVQCLRSFA